MHQRIAAALVLILSTSIAVPVWAQGLGENPGSFFDKLFGASLPGVSPADTAPRERASQPAPSAVTPAVGHTPQSLPIAQQFALSGVVVAERTQMALLEELGGGAPQAPRFVHVGEAVGAYHLTAIEADRVTLSGPGGAVVVLLSIGGAGGAGASAGHESRTPSPSQPTVPRVAVSAAPAVSPVAEDRQLRALDRLELNQAKNELKQAEKAQKAQKRARGARNAAGGQAPKTVE